MSDPVTPKRIALCFSGHLRYFNQCSDLLFSNFIQPLQDKGFHVDVFAHLWNVTGDRYQNWTGSPDMSSFNDKLQPKSVDIENFSRDFFIFNYSSNQWLTRRHLSCFSTSGDASSMWYSIHKSFTLAEQYQTQHNFVYDVICRIRPDLVFESPIDITEINDILYNDVLYIPIWSGRYYDVCHEIVDYFAMGNYNIMKNYCSTFEKISTYLMSDDYIHTAEGFLLAQVKEVPIKRTNMRFSLQRKSHRENTMPQ